MLTEWLVDTARHAGYAAQSTSIPGVAQRTGATTYYVEVFPVPLAELAGRRPVFSLSPVPGALDAIISSELLETTRQIGNGMSAPERTIVITSSSRTLTTAERMQLGDGRADAQRLLDVVKAFSREHHVFDMGAAARDAGTIVSAVMLGAIAGSGLFPFPREAYERVVRGGDTSAPKSSARWRRPACAVSPRPSNAVNAPRRQASMVASLLASSGDEAPAANPLPQTVAALFPPPVHDMLALGHARVLDYQERRLRRPVRRASPEGARRRAASDPAGAQGFAVTREMARWLALWMAFDDIVRVAELKSRASRARRVRDEVKAGEDDIVKVYDHFKPGAPSSRRCCPARWPTA